MKYLGFIIEAGVGLRMDPEKIKVIREWEAFKIKKGVRVFLRFANYYRAFIDKFVTTVVFFTVFMGKYFFFGYPRPKKPSKV